MNRERRVREVPTAVSLRDHLYTTVNDQGRCSVDLLLRFSYSHSDHPLPITYISQPQSQGDSPPNRQHFLRFSPRLLRNKTLICLPQVGDVDIVFESRWVPQDDVV